jgi:glycerol-3-phosphate cytidylyltransferase
MTIYIPMTADLFHIGHLRAIKQCQRIGIPIIGLLTDKAIFKYKGKYPIIPFEQRKEILEAIGCFCHHIEVVRQDDINPLENLKKYRPTYLASGDGFEESEKMSAKELGIKLFNFNYCKLISTTKIKQKICQNC